ncbi:AraC family transcriptional regulator [Vibrio sp. Y29_XK_CS5]|uniref:helix-turn-helix domain-containing protein n=1 Tax=Vibrio sp. Y29_XK_CS5 TaxID=2957762 RepID=UPI0020A53453|nr:AraC family transcriptional regulator [Vibrio sp. Y29_XK_CS5]
MKFKKYNNPILELKPFYNKKHVLVLIYGYEGDLIINNNKLACSNEDAFIISPGLNVGCSLKKKYKDAYIYFITLSNSYITNLRNTLKSVREDRLSYNSYENSYKSKFVRIKYSIDEVFLLFNGIEILENTTLNKDLVLIHLKQSCFFIFSSMHTQGYDLSVLFEQDYYSTKEKLIKNILLKPEIDWNLQVASEILFISSSTLRKHLSLENTTFSELLTETRLGLALNYLTFSDYSIGRIAEMTGFNSSAYFSTAFKKKHGTTPKEFRKNSKLLNSI